MKSETFITTEMLLVPYGEVSLAKAVVFRSMANVQIENQEYINAVIDGYYALLHMTIACMFLNPMLLDQKPRDKYFRLRMSNTDPTSKISHSDALNFLKVCHTKGLPLNCVNTFEFGQSFREYVNYAPRVTIKESTNSIIFGACKYSKMEAEQFVKRCDGFIEEMIKFGVANDVPKLAPFKLALQIFPRYIKQADLFYSEWLSDRASDYSIVFAQRIVNLIK